MFSSRGIQYFFPVVGILLRVMFLAFNEHATVLTSPLPDSFPTDNEIRRAFLGVGRDETFVTSEILVTRDLYQRFATRYAPKKSLEDVFSSYFLIYQPGQSGLCYNDFVDRCCKIFAEKSSGDVFLLSKWPHGPSEPDSLFNSIEFPAFKDNPYVTRIYLVNPNDISQRILFWPKDPDSSDDDKVETVLEGSSLEHTLDTLTFTAGAAAGGLTILQGGLGTTLAPFLLPGNERLTPQDNEEQAPGETRLDSFFGDTASLPGSSDSVDATQFFSTEAPLPIGDDKSLFTTVPDFGAEAFSVAMGDGEVDEAITFGSLNGIEPDTLVSVSDESMDLFGSSTKRHLALQPRACAPRPGIEQDLPFLFEGITPLGGTNTADNADVQTLIPFPGALPAYAAVHVVQRRLPDSPGVYKLDVEIRNSGGEVIGSAADADAFGKQRIEVQSPLPYRLQVWTPEGNDDQPLKFQYGPMGPEWDSNDSSPETHDCKTDEWKGDHREVDCKFGV
jgi:hypothetical protein